MSTTSESQEAPSFASAATESLVQILAQAGISILVTTYQAGKLIMVRSNGREVNTHFRGFHVPMGMAYDNGRLAIGTKTEICAFYNNRDVARDLPPAGSHDACFLPRYRYATGDIRVHEMAWIGDELWAINTRFSCLSTFGPAYSFQPRWRPSFITALMPEDRCHLNGLSTLDGRIRHVSCLGMTDTENGWRANKARGGALLTYPDSEVLASGLSMPHSPRYHGGKLWLLESGVGSLSLVDEKTGALTEVVRLPGFTRGLDFFGPFALIGLSLARETAAFSGIPIVDAGKPLQCGVWVVDLRSGQVVAFLRFEGSVQEIFAVQVLPGIGYPELLDDTADEALSNSFVLPDEYVPREGGSGEKFVVI